MPWLAALAVALAVACFNLARAGVWVTVLGWAMKGSLAVLALALAVLAIVVVRHRDER